MVGKSVNRKLDVLLYALRYFYEYAVNRKLKLSSVHEGKPSLSFDSDYSSVSAVKKFVSRLRQPVVVRRSPLSYSAMVL